MGNISLTASMRSNLQSLQGIAASQNVVQNRLATGLKVSSAIENPSSFYTAQSLNNRSADLGMLLDSMSQGIQTIKSATQAIDIATKMLEQAKATAVQSMDKAGVAKTVITKNWLIENGVSANDIVSTKDELIIRMNTAQAGDRIVVWGDIDMGNTELTMKDGVKLVGANYVINQKNLSKSHKVEATDQGKITFNKTTSANGITVGDNTEISDLSLELTTIGKANNQGLIYNHSKTLTLRNLDLKQIDNSGTGEYVGVILNNGNAVTNLEGVINIQTAGTGGYNVGIININNSAKIIQKADSELNITTSGERGYGIWNGTNTLNGSIKITTSGKWAYGIVNGINTFSGNVNMLFSEQPGFGFAYGNHTFKSSAKIMIENKTAINTILYADANKASYTWEKGAQIGFKNATGSTNALWEARNSGSVVDKTTHTTDLAVSPFGWDKIGTFPGFSVQRHVEQHETSSQAREISPRATLGRNDNNGALGRNDSIPLSGSAQYSSILAQFNNLIKDAGYKGINLLLEQNLKINFNEDRSSGIDIKGVDASTKGLGLETFSWKSAEDIEKSIAELDLAISKLRGFSAEFGNSFSIVSTREKFTESIINVLTEGADKLTLADMNQESANMLALQTRQQLAVNSLSLASQAAQSVLKLF